MMTTSQIDTATREQLADELAAACEPTEDWQTAGVEDLRERVRTLVEIYAVKPLTYHIVCRDSDGDERVNIQDGDPVIAGPDNATTFANTVDAQAEANRLDGAEEHGDRSYHVVESE
jgi:hypothetical protein